MGTVYRLDSNRPLSSKGTPTDRGRTRFFRNLDLLRGLPESELESIERSARELTLRKKHTIWSVDDPADRVFLVRSGVVKLSKPMDNSRELTLQFFTRNAPIGQAAAPFHRPRDTRCEAYEDCTLYSVSREEILRASQRNPELAIRLAQIAAERRRRLENRLRNLIFRTAHSRLAGLFLDLSEDFGVRASRGVIVNLKLTHKEMAALIGATRETVSFAVLDLRREGLILTESRRVIILDSDRLRALRDQ